MRLHLYDTTLRDGTQREGISLSVEDKLRIAGLLEEFGIPYVEGGWPGSNPKDAEFFRRARLRRSKLVAFGWTRRDDALLRAETPAVAIVGKSSRFHVERVLETTPDENLRMISESVAWAKNAGREVIYDAEHFFDAYREDPAHAMRTLEAAAEADWIVLCDTNGGSLPGWIAKVVAGVAARFPKVGIHTHNDGELAVANAIAAVEAGARQVQGTVNGYGERCGNANLVSLLPTLQMKMGFECVPALGRLTELSRTISEIANLSPDAHAPYVGASAFAHKGGIHVAAVEKVTESYEHVAPELVGNRRRVVVSELAGRGNIRMRAAEWGLQLNGREKVVLERVKEAENRGYQYESAEGSFELMVRKAEAGYAPPFELQDVMVVARRGATGMVSEATVRVRVAGTVIHTAAEGDGPVHALDRSLRKALLPWFPDLVEVRLADYKVRILDPDQATGATTRVFVEAARGTDRWCTVGVSPNIIDASCQALCDGYELFLLRGGHCALHGV